MYAGAALATLTKGPIGFLLPGLIIFLFLAVTKSWQEVKQMKLCSGTLLFLIIGLPWYLAMISLHGDALQKLFWERITCCGLLFPNTPVTMSFIIILL